MGSPLGSVSANIFMCSFESKWLRDCPNDFKPVFYRRCVDDIFAHADKFEEYLLSKHPNINFSIEKEKDGCSPFLLFLFCNYALDFEDFSIFTTNNDDFKVSLMDSHLINRDHPSLNKNKNLYLWNFLIAKEQSFTIW